MLLSSLAFSALLSATPVIAEPIAQDRRSTAHTYCYLSAQYEGEPWHLYVSAVGSFPSASGDAWPYGDKGPVAAAWGAHLRSTGVRVDVLARSTNARFPMCFGYTTMAEVEQSRNRLLEQYRASAVGYQIHELPWRPSAPN